VKECFPGEKIITSREMARVEGLAFARGESAEEFMNRAGLAMANLIEEFIDIHRCTRTVTLLTGKGNNAGDAYVIGLELLQRGFLVEALHLYSFDLCGPLCRSKAESFQRAGGRIHPLHKEGNAWFPSDGVIVDGLVGTGFRGAPEELMSSVIDRANQSGLPIIAVDIPSGLSGDTGEVASVAIRAAMTIYLGLPKLGFFLGKGYDHIGMLKKADFGLSAQDIANAKEVGILYDTEHAKSYLPRISRTQHKYLRGYAMVWAGSIGMPGAALLCCMGAFRAGAGIVRLYHEENMETQLVTAPWELIREPLLDWRDVLQESKRAGSVVIGPGLGRTKTIRQTLKKLLSKLGCPTVLDAEALDFLAHHTRQRLPKETILTPHRGELARLLGKHNEMHGEEFLHAVQTYVQEKEVMIVCKGAPTILFHPDQTPLFFPVGNPGMATAGSGDVLSGIIAAFLAAGLPLLQAAMVSVWVHGEAGDIAAKKKSTRSVMASDLIEALPEVYCKFE